MRHVVHLPVLRDEAIGSLLTDVTRVYIDATLGGGGHTEEICMRIQGSGRVVCFERDGDALEVARKRLVRFQDRVVFVHSNFRNLEVELQQLGVSRIQGVLFDLGVSSFQLDESSKGFSFRGDDRIDMRMDRRQLLTGWDVVNRYGERELALLLWKYGEERNSRRIAKRIITSRPVETTRALAEVVKSTVGGRFVTKSLARVFQAIRMEVNNEPDNLEAALTASLNVLVPSGRLVVISYHSLEDRMVKEFFKRNSAESVPSGNKYLPDTSVVPRLKVLTRKPITPSVDEIQRNPRSRSAKMRVAERNAS